MLQLATLADREAVNAIAKQIHDLHVAWRPDIFCASEEPYPKEKFLEDIRSANARKRHSIALWRLSL